LSNLNLQQRYQENKGYKQKNKNRQRVWRMRVSSLQLQASMHRWKAFWPTKDIELPQYFSTILVTYLIFICRPTMSSSSSCSSSRSSRKATLLERLDEDDIFFYLMQANYTIHAETQWVRKHKCSASAKKAVFFAHIRTEKNLLRRIFHLVEFGLISVERSISLEWP